VILDLTATSVFVALFLLVTWIGFVAARWRKNCTQHRSQRKTRRSPILPSTSVIRELHCGQVAASSR